MCKYANDNGNVNWFGFRFLGFSFGVCNVPRREAQGEVVALFAALVAHFVDFCVATGSRLLSAVCLPAACQCHVRHFIVILMQGSSFAASAIDYAKLLAGQRERER